MNLPEQAIYGPFRITSIKHIIPQKKPVDDDESDEYDFRPVTALFTHESSQVLDISFENGEKLGVTYQHPIFSATSGHWKLAGELEIGEEVLTKTGSTTVVSTTKKDGSEKVYNLEVKDLHNFLVGTSGIIVHNSCLNIYLKLFFGNAQRWKMPGKDWTWWSKGSGKPTTNLHEVDQLEVLGADMQKKMIILDKDKHGNDFPGIDAITEDGTPVTLKQVTSSNLSKVTTRVREMGEKATNANATADFGGVMSDITGMITAKNFTIAQIKGKITLVRTNHPSSSAIIKKYFIEGSDGTDWMVF